MPANIAPSQVHGPRDVAAILAAMESAAGERIDEVNALRAVLVAYFTTYNLPTHVLLSSELENILCGICDMQPALLPVTAVFCRAIGVRPPVAYYENGW